MTRTEFLIQSLELRPHPEGGYFREVYRSPSLLSLEDRDGVRAWMTTIYYLLTSGQRSRWHRVCSDELWHYYEGDPLQLNILDSELQELKTHYLEPINQQSTNGLVCVVSANAWQSAKTTGEYTLVGCTVSPGFEFNDFTFMSECTEEARKLATKFPALIEFL